MTTFLLHLDPGPGTGPTVAVKDLIDVAGTPTTCASRPVAAAATPAEADAECIATVRASGGRIVGKVNLHELAFGGSGINPYTGTPANPRDPNRIPGGSSSGSAVAVAAGEADVALGTDSAGSVRTPAACCGVLGLKTTDGRIPLAGVQALAPSLDTVGPLARDVGGIATAMALLEPGFVPAERPAALLGRVRLTGVARWVDDAVDRLLTSAGLPVEATVLPGWDHAEQAGTTVLFGEAARVHAALLDRHADELGDEVRERLERGARVSDAELASAIGAGERWRAEVDAALHRSPVLVTAGIADDPAPLDDPSQLDTRRLNVAVNLGGHPALVLPVPVAGRRFPASVQLIGAHGAEDLLVATAAVLEAAATRA